MTVDATKVAEVYTITRPDAGEVYPITFPYIHKEYVKCYVANEETKEQTNLVLGIGYTINDETHELTVIDNQAVGNKVVIYRVTELTQEIDWEDGQAVYTPDIEQADDKLTHIVQELAEQVDRSVKITKQEAAAGTNPEYRWEEIEEAREQVLAAQSATEQARVDAEQAKEDAESARDETLEARDTALDTIGAAQTEAQEAIATDKHDALDAIETGKTDAIAGINRAAQSAQQDIADDTQDAKDSIAASTATAQQTILEDSATALNAINTAAQAGVDSIDNAASGYSQAITQAKTDAITEVDASGAGWVDKAKTEADRAKTEADRAKTEADRAESIVDIGPATTEKLGLVKVGENLSIDANGTLNATGGIEELPIATATKVGVIKVGSGLSVTADGTVSANAQPVNVATSDTAGIVKPSIDMNVETDGTLSDKVDAVYMQERPTSVPENLKNGGLIFYEDEPVAQFNDAPRSGGSGELPELTEEHVVGYLNGKPVYEKTVQTTAPSTTSSAINIYDATNLNIKILLSLSGIITVESMKSSWPFNWSPTTGGDVIQGIRTHFYDNHVRMKLGMEDLLNAPTTITLCYTKTTD